MTSDDKRRGSESARARTLADLLEAWREAERELGRAKPDSKAWDAARERVDRAREAYQKGSRSEER
ncbi:MAG TPA: hypothetical protein VGC90_10140 [Candidatus Limnocylindrales bacterium]